MAAELQAEDDRAVAKVSAIRDIVANSGVAGHTATSPSAAEKLVEFHPLYQEARDAQRHAVIAAYAARGDYEVAKLHARLCVEAVAATTEDR